MAMKISASFPPRMDAPDYNDAVIRVSEVKEAIFKLELNKSDGVIGIQSDNFVNAGND